MIKRILCLGLAALMLASCSQKKEPVDYVNPYIGNISHLLVPTFPTIQLPNSMLRVYPERADYTSEYLNGLPIIVTNHRERSAFLLSATLGDRFSMVPVSYDNEHITPYSFDVDLADGAISARYALSHQSAIYSLEFSGEELSTVTMGSKEGHIEVDGNIFRASQKLDDKTTVYVYMEADKSPEACGIVRSGLKFNGSTLRGKNVSATMQFKEKTVNLRYGVSFISVEQAEANLRREIKDYDIDKLAAEGRKIWNETLGRMEVQGNSEDDLIVFYTSYYRTFERPICMSEDGRYWSAFDGQVHEDGGVPFYTDDWIWDTYRAAHPLRILMDRDVEEDVLSSYLRMAEQMGTMWMPTFPEVTGDSRRMNSNHSIATFADAISKGLDVDKKKAYEAARGALKEKTLAPWCGNPAGWLDKFFWEKGYVPALREGEAENDPNVHHFEKRQPVAVSLGTYYDCFCMGVICASLGMEEEAYYYLEQSDRFYDLFRQDTKFFHPKDRDGKWIENLDYDFPGGMGAREYYDENNAWVYRWDVQHNIKGLIELFGGKEEFVKELDRMFAKPLGRSKFEFFAKLPDHTGNVGQFSMANEPSMHVPYLYDYAGYAWKTQKRVRQMLKTWFRNDLMGVPGDEDGGGLTSFVVFSSLGFYPVTPGMPGYAIGSPLFSKVKMHLTNGKCFEIVANNVSDDNKYIVSAKLNGKPLDRPFISHEAIMEGGRLVFEMSDKPNKEWGK